MSPKHLIAHTQSKLIVALCLNVIYSLAPSELSGLAINKLTKTQQPSTFSTLKILVLPSCVSPLIVAV